MSGLELETSGLHTLRMSFNVLVIIILNYE